MLIRPLGSSGLAVSRLGLGTLTWGVEVDEDEARDHAAAFTAAGGTLIDTAAGYGDGAAETIVGRLLASGILPRDEVVLVSKAGLRPGPTGRVVDVSRRALLSDLDASLTRLGIDHLDVWLVHAWSDGVPLAETLGALEYAVSSGRARYVGVSNYSGWQTARALSLLEAARISLIANEVEYSLLHRDAEHEVLPAARALGFGVLSWAALGRGILTGKYRGGIPPQSRAGSRVFPRFLERYLDERAVAITEAVVTAARGLDVPAAQVALAWARDTPGVSSVIVGARTLPQLQIALASESVVLPAPVRDALADISA